MIRLSKDEENRIRNRLDYIAEDVNNGRCSIDSLKWCHETIKRLLFDIYMLQNVNGEENVIGDGERIIANLGNKSSRSKREFLN